MKSKLISVFIATMLSIVGLCSTISHAADKELIIQVAYDTASTHSVNLVKLIKQTPIETTSLDNMLNRPLLNLYSTITTEYIPEQDFIKKNEVFELATRFNDKLQQIIAKFSSNESSQHKQYLINNDKRINNNAVNCRNY